MRREDITARSVLIIDEDLGIAERLAGLLRSRGYTAICVDTPARALAALRGPPDRGRPPPVALIDVWFGGAASGVDLIRRLCAEQPGLVCAVMAADIDGQTAIAALRQGASDYFDKAGDPGLLFAVIERCFERVAAQRERESAHLALRRAKAAAEAASRSKSRFIATLSHELRTPLNAIIGFSEMMLHEVLGAVGHKQYRDYVADIHASGAHLLQIINDILDLSTAESGRIELHEAVFDLRDAIASVRRLVSSRIGDGGLSYAVELPADFPLLRADERKTKQVLLNLVANAVKFTPPGGLITIAGHFDRKAGLRLTVSDTGIGIAPGDLARVLEPFQQVDSVLGRAHRGTGLGLPLVKAIIERHGGSLQLRSEVGVGTQAEVTFPPDRAVFDPADPQSRNAA
ncbi:MAG TPA: ATP-binding protein [Stellaceae bacterium]|nr:ATP-binding protein [Stellaceae bacterium]